MAKVPRNKGSYDSRRGGGYQVRFPLGWNESKKKYERYYEDVASEAEAIALIKAINDFVYHGGDPTEVPGWRAGVKAERACSTLTVAQFAEEFTSIREKQRKVEQRTIQSDRECFARIKPYIGDMLLTAVTPRDIDLAYARMRSSGPDNLGGYAYSGTSLQKTHAYLSMLFDKAVDYEYLDKNPMTRVERPRRDTAEKTALSPEEAQALFSAIASEPLAAKPIGVLLCMSCGLRLSEMLALKWSDYSAGCIKVSKSLRPDKQEFKKTKNGEDRTIPCPPPLITLLDDWKRQQRSWYSEQGLRWSKDTPIVNSNVGNHTLQRSFGKWFESARMHYPIPDDFTVHGLRHTFVTLLNRDCGIDPRTTRSMSGHKSEQAFAIYTHTNEEWQRQAAFELGSIIAPDDDSKRCQNCKLWTASPYDSTKGVCWADEKSLFVAGSVDYCVAGAFSVRKVTMR